MLYFMIITCFENAYVALIDSKIKFNATIASKTRKCVENERKHGENRNYSATIQHFNKNNKHLYSCRT